MKKNDVQIGGIYGANVSGKRTRIQITGESCYGGWNARNLATQKTIRIKSPQRLHLALQSPGAGKPKKATEAMTLAQEAAGQATSTKASTTAPRAPQRQDGTMSGLDAAATILREVGEAMNCKAMVACAIDKGYWKPNGLTPWATLYSAILREILKKGNDARFRKVERGKFAIVT